MISTLRKTMMYLGLAEPVDENDETKNKKRTSSNYDHQSDLKQKSGKHLLNKQKNKYFKHPMNNYYNTKNINNGKLYHKEENSIDELHGGLKQINTFHPQSYNDAKTIGESFRSGIPIIMNVTDMSEADAKRLVDFSAGLAFGLYGAIEKVTSKVFLLSPSYVEILGDERGKEKNASNNFFNHQV